MVVPLRLAHPQLVHLRRVAHRLRQRLAHQRVEPPPVAVVAAVAVVAEAVAAEPEGLLQSFCIARSNRFSILRDQFLSWRKRLGEG